MEKEDIYALLRKNIKHQKFRQDSEFTMEEEEEEETRRKRESEENKTHFMETNMYIECLFL